MPVHRREDSACRVPPPHTDESTAGTHGISVQSRGTEGRHLKSLDRNPRDARFPARFPAKFPEDGPKGHRPTLLTPTMLDHEVLILVDRPPEAWSAPAAVRLQHQAPARHRPASLRVQLENGGGGPGSASEVTLRGASRRALLTSLSFFGPPLPHAASAGFQGKRRVFSSSRHSYLRLQPLLAAIPTPRMHRR